MKFDKWVKTHLGKKVDYDGAYGVQCVDLIKSFIAEVLEVKPQAIGNAIDYYKKRNKLKYLKENFTAFNYKKGFSYQKGDIIVMQGSSVYGHIAVCNGKYDTKGVYAYDENYKGSGAGMTERFFDFGGYYTIKCVLRPKNQKNLGVSYYPRYEGRSVSIVDALKSMNIDASYKHRVKIAAANGIKFYTGTPSENIKLLKLFRIGKLIKE